ncbi:hypothetical protein PPACK8108_LOCUS15534, partial [Phakopsora pachyrhizi]
SHCFQTGTFLVTFGLISFVLTQLTLSGKNFIESFTNKLDPSFNGLTFSLLLRRNGKTASSPPIISRPNGSNFKGEDNVIDPTSQIEMSLWILKFSIPLAISILLRDRKIKKLSTAKNYNSL